ncbi:MAG: hypothetical protein JWN80_3118 [Microbacteriaceae bacterium]|nr:hypothetical protein [Microbacteriaceae bacterium]
MNSTKDLTQVLVELDGALTALDSETADRFAALVGFDGPIADDVIRAISDVAEWDGPPIPDGELAFRIGKWRLDLTIELARATVMAAIIGGTLATAGVTDIPVAVLTAVVPSLVTVERVSLRDGDRRLLIEVRRKKKLVDHRMSSDQIYDGLPKKVQRQLNRYDFADFIERLRALGIAEGDSDKVRLRPQSERVPLLSWR